MSTLDQNVKNQITTTLKQGGIIAYPTEGVYGLGCDPYNESAVKKIAALKGRSLSKGFILIASSWSQIESLILPITPQQLNEVKTSWPGPSTWVFPCSKKVPAWIRGSHKSIALRITDHPIARAICETCNQAIVSTSANTSGETPLYNAAEVRQRFGQQIDYVVEGEVGLIQQPTPIRDALSGGYLRK